MRWTWLLLLLLVVAGCQQKMARQPYLEPLEPSPFFGQAGSFRTPPAGTVARSDTVSYTHLRAHETA
ncbi:MAG: hypothetical protein QUU85_13535, partial [Candidatus Eisenbacteria bacterium]|nr:hypothetical protein [Candidatus Eisenbacteria bacterium]